MMTKTGLTLVALFCVFFLPACDGDPQAGSGDDDATSPEPDDDFDYIADNHHAGMMEYFPELN